MPNELVYSAEVTGFDKVESALKSQASSFEKTAVAAGKFDQSLKKINPGANQATQSMGNLSRVVQDAPFGFIAISNNINPLLESFQRLKVETGSSKEAFKALGSSLTGAGGIGLAVGVVTSLLVVFGDKLFASNKAIAATNLQLVEFERVARNAKDSLKDFNKEADGLLKLNAANITERFGSGFNAQFLNAQATFVKISEELVVAQEQVPILYENSSKAYRYYLDNATRATRDFVGQFGDLSAIPESLLSKLPESQQAIVKAAQEASKALTDVQNKVKELTLEREIQAATNRALSAEESRRLAKEAAERKKRTQTLKQDVDELKRGIQSQSKILNDEYFNLFYGLDKSIQGLANRMTPVNVPLIIIPSLKEIEKLKFQKEFEAYVKGLQENVTQLYQQLGLDLFSGLGEIFGALATDGISGAADVFKNLLGLVGDFLIQLGKAAIAASAVGEALKKLQLNPQLGLVAGLAAIAIGSIIKSQIPKFAVGTRSAPGGLSLVGERGPELLSLPRGAQVTPAAQTANLLSGGDGYIAETRLSGNDLLILLKRAEKSYGKTA